MEPIYQVFLVLEVMIFLLCLLTNGVIIVACRRDLALKSDLSKQFILCLAASDMGIGLFTIPLDVLICVIKYDFNFEMCLLTECTTLIFINTSALIIICTTFERYLAIAWPFSYEEYVNVKRVRLVSFSCFITGLLSGMAPMAGWNTGKDNYTTCSFSNVMDKNFMFYCDFGVMFLLPVIVIVLPFSFIGEILKKDKKLGKNKLFHNIVKRRRKNLINQMYVITIIVSVFVTFRLPMYIFRFAKGFSPKIQYIAVIMIHLHPIINPYIFTLNRSIRAAVLKFCLEMISGEISNQTRQPYSEQAMESISELGTQAPPSSPESPQVANEFVSRRTPTWSIDEENKGVAKEISRWPKREEDKGVAKKFSRWSKHEENKGVAKTTLKWSVDERNEGVPVAKTPKFLEVFEKEDRVRSASISTFSSTSI